MLFLQRTPNDRTLDQVFNATSLKRMLMVEEKATQTSAGKGTCSEEPQYEIVPLLLFSSILSRSK